MGRMMVGAPSEGERIGAIIGIVLLCLGVVCGAFYRNSQAYMAKCFRGSNPSGEAAAYLQKYPDGKYIKEAVDSIYSDYDSSFKTYYIKDYGDRDTVSNIPFLIEVRDRMRSIHPLAGNAIDSLIKQRALVEYNKAVTENTMDAWRLYYRVIPSEYSINK